MMAGGELPFEEMKLAQLKEELAARGSTRSGVKATLQRRLHGLLVKAWIAARAVEAEESGFGAAAEAAHAAAAGARGRERAAREYEALGSDSQEDEGGS